LHKSDAPEPPTVELPQDWVWGDFLIKMGWQDKRVLDAQEYWFVKQQFCFYGYKRQYGLLG
jgi:hypothetical protein